MNDFIKNLSLEDKKKRKSLVFRYLKRIFLIFLYASICISVAGLRKDLSSVIHDNNFLLEFGLILLLTINSIVLSIKVSTYGQEKNLNTKKVILLIFSWIGLNVFLLLGNSNFYFSSILDIFNDCFIHAFFVSFIPSILMVAYYYKKGILYPKWLGLSTFLLSAMSSAIFLQMSCPSTNPWHNLGSHTFPVLIISAIGVLIFWRLGKK